MPIVRFLYQTWVTVKSSNVLARMLGLDVLVPVREFWTFPIGGFPIADGLATLGNSLPRLFAELFQWCILKTGFYFHFQFSL
jgi:hypothetical protein